MQGSKSSQNHSSSIFSSALAHSASILTPRRLGYTVAGAFVFVGAAVTLHGSSAANQGQNPNPQDFSVQASTVPPPDTTSSDTTSGGASSSTSFSSSTSGSGHTKVQLNVNGRDIPVPANGSTEQTVTSQDGNTQTTVTTNSSTQGDAQNVSSSNFSVNVSSSSSSTGGARSDSD